MYKGTLYVYDNDGNLVKTYHNRFVLSGRYFALEALFPFTRGGATWLDDIDANDLNTRYFGCGSGTTADGVTGPVTGTGVSTTGTWQGASLYDWQLDNEFTAMVRGTITVNNRVNRSMEIEITITAGVNVVADVDINEIGIFLGNDDGHPTHSPDQDAWDINDRKHGMLARIVLYQIIDDKYEIDPITIGSGLNKTLKYVFQDI